MIMNKQLLYILLILFTFFSCTNDITESEAGVGSVTFSVENAADDVVIETRALSSNIDEDLLQVSLTRGGESILTDTYKSIKGRTYTYSAASDYHITATNCTESEAESKPDVWGKDRVYGEKTFAVVANENNSVELTCRLANSGISVDFSGYVKNKWPDCKVEVYAADDADRKFTFNQHVYKRAFFNVDEARAIQYVVTLQENSGGHTEDAEGKPFSLTIMPGHYYNLSVKMLNEDTMNPQLTIGISVDGSLKDEITLPEVVVNPYQ